MKQQTVCLIFILLSILSCKKDQIQPDSGTSQLWLKVDQSVPDFTLTLKCSDVKTRENIYTVTCTNQTLSPNLKSVSVNGNGTRDTWIQVYKAFDRTSEVTLKLINGKVYKTRGFEFKEKRAIEIVSTSSGSVNVVDRDISIIEKTILVD